MTSYFDIVYSFLSSLWLFIRDLNCSVIFSMTPLKLIVAGEFVKVIYFNE